MTNYRTGTDGNDSLFGTFGIDNWIEGRGGNDTLRGGNGGDDTLFGGDGDDSLDGWGAGESRIYGGAGNDTMYGGAGVISWMEGNDGNDLLVDDSGYDLGSRGGGGRMDGGAGADTMKGGSLANTYVVDSAFDVIVEVYTGPIIDTVESQVSWVLGANLENLTLIGAAAVNATGNGLANMLTGNGAGNELTGGDGNDTLDGGAGADTMRGGAGDDLYVVASAADSVQETTTPGGATDAGGTDGVFSSVSFTLPNFVENLWLQTGGAINATGNALGNALLGNNSANVLNALGGNDIVYGGDGADTLSGGTGADTMLGGAGNDTYTVDNFSDQVVESTKFGGTVNAGGTDLVNARLSYTLPKFVEQLVLTGSAAINGTGNAGANTITGNSAPNVLRGYAKADFLVGAGGDDKLYGGLGKDTLHGGLGADTFMFDTGATPTGNVDQIQGFERGSDRIGLDDDIFGALGVTGTTVGAALDALRFVNGTAALDADDRIIYDQSTGTLYYDADGTGATAKLKFAVLGNAPALDAADFLVFS